MHDELMTILRGLPQDSTYRAHENILDCARDSKFAACFDLKSFTERLPVELQFIVLKHVMGEKVAVL